MLQQNSGHYLSTIQQLLDEVSPKLSPPPASSPPFPFPLFPTHKAPGSPVPHSPYSQNFSSFTGVAAAAAASQRFSPYHYNRSALHLIYTDNWLTSLTSLQAQSRPPEFSLQRLPFPALPPVPLLPPLPPELQPCPESHPRAGEVSQPGARAPWLSCVTDCHGEKWVLQKIRVVIKNNMFPTRKNSKKLIYYI